MQYRCVNMCIFCILVSISGPNQVDLFLSNHGGEGVQHVGLHTDNIIGAISHLQSNGVQFNEAPYTYYTEVLYGTVEIYNNIITIIVIIMITFCTTSVSTLLLVLLLKLVLKILL